MPTRPNIRLKFGYANWGDALRTQGKADAALAADRPARRDCLPEDRRG